MRKVTRKDIVDILKNMDLEVDVNELSPTIELISQNIDSLDMMNLFFTLEEIYSIKISEESLENKKWKTIDEIVQNVNELLTS